MRYFVGTDPPRPLRILVVDDHLMFADSLVRLLQLETDFDVLEPCVNATEALQLLETSLPDLALVDFNLPDSDGVQLTRDLLARAPEMRVIMLTGLSDELVMLRAIEAGASGFLTKDRAATDLTDSLRLVARGDPLITPEVFARVLARLPRHRTPPVSALSDREREVLQLMAEGLTTRAMAEHLFLSVNTVRNYSQAVLTKLGAHSKLEAVALAVRSGIIDPPSS
ncbi:MAG: response regulator transcription factor [Acidimicrobiaceae bacterium]|nr:response regulator transcription factor [Acidimicrobiaceae bacterium]